LLIGKVRQRISHAHDQECRGVEMVPETQQIIFYGPDWPGTAMALQRIQQCAGAVYRQDGIPEIGQGNRMHPESSAQIDSMVRLRL
jgi:hypothetical protein